MSIQHPEVGIMWEFLIFILLFFLIKEATKVTCERMEKDLETACIIGYTRIAWPIIQTNITAFIKSNLDF